PQTGGVDAARLQGIQFGEEHLDVDDDTVGDDRYDPVGEDAARKQVEGVLLVADDDGVSRIVAAVELDDVVDATAEKVGGFAFTFVAPLGADEDNCGHG